MNHGYSEKSVDEKITACYLEAEQVGKLTLKSLVSGERNNSSHFEKVTHNNRPLYPCG